MIHDYHEVLNFNRVVWDDLKLPNDGGEIFKFQGRRWQIQIPVVKSPLYLAENLLDGQLPHVLWCWHVGLLSSNKQTNKQTNKKNKNKNKNFEKKNFNRVIYN